MWIWRIEKIGYVVWKPYQYWHRREDANPTTRKSSSVLKHPEGGSRGTGELIGREMSLLCSILAEAQGFEPRELVKVQRFSRPPP
jgi:hypothetical protein